MHDSPTSRFWDRLYSNQIESILSNNDFLQQLRYDYSAFRRIQRTFGSIFQQRGISLWGRVLAAERNSSEVVPGSTHGKKDQSSKLLPLGRAGNCSFLPTVLVKLIHSFAGPNAPPAPPPEPRVIEWDASGNYGSFPTAVPRVHGDFCT